MKGQIGIYLHKLLLLENCEVFGTTRGETQAPYFHCDLTDYKNVSDIIDLINPDEIYNLAGETNSNNSILHPLETFDINGKAVMIMCEKIKNTKKEIKLFQALSSELFKGSKDILITPENTLFYPKTPYSIAKLSAYWTIRYYRERYNLAFYNGFIFNTESPFRKEGFLTKKISKTLLSNNVLQVENLESRKNWLHAEDVANAIKISMTGIPGEYVFSTGVTNTIKELIEVSYKVIGKTIIWENNKGIDSESKQTLVISNESYRIFDQNENVYGIDPKMQSLGWKPKYNLFDIMNDIITN